MRKKGNYKCTNPGTSLTVCRMIKNKGNGFKRTGESLRVSGFKESDSYDTTQQKATVPLLTQKVHYSKSDLVVPSGRVVDVPLQNIDSWALGGYLKEMGGSARCTPGVYLETKVRDIDYCIHDAISELTSNTG